MSTHGGDVSEATQSIALGVRLDPDMKPGEQFAKVALDGIASCAAVAYTFGNEVFKPTEQTSVGDTCKVLQSLSDSAATGDLGHAERLLSAQMMALNSMFASLTLKAQANLNARTMKAGESYLRLALKAQAQCRQTAETLFEMKNPRPVAFVQQANFANGPQQVNNATVRAREPATSTHERAGARQIENSQSEVLEHDHGQRMDPRAQGEAIRRNPALAAVGAINGAAYR